MNALAFVPAWVARTEKFYDLTGSATYLAVVALALATGSHGARSTLLAGLIAAWAIRLGSFLFARIRAAGRDPRFDAIKRDFGRFLLAFLLQGLWVSLTAGAALAAMTAASTAAMSGSITGRSTTAMEQLDLPALAGLLVWLAGFALEVVADRQKRAFRADPANHDRFITTGLWARCRHPNYLGEIVLWTGIALIAAPALTGWQRLTLVSPVFVALLLTRISGIPLLEARARKRWGSDPAYLAYLERTPRLIPRR
jgi:steroid 5-alpha reductase family enzyme